MQSVTNLFKTLWANPAHKVELKAVIGSTTITDALILGYTSNSYAFENAPSAGNVVSARFQLALDISNTTPVIPKMANIKVYLRLTVGTSSSEWIPQGEWFVDTRKTTEADELVLTGYDALLKAEQSVYDTETSDTYPCSDIVMLGRLATKLGVTIDTRTTTLMNKGYQIDFPGIGVSGYSIREVLSSIAALYGGNFIITDAGQLRLLSFSGLPTSSTTADYDVGNNVTGLDVSDALEPFTRATVEVGAQNDGELIVYTAGSDTGRELYVVSPYGTQTVANNIRSAITGKAYQPLSATEAELIPAAELGDVISVAGKKMVLYSRQADYDADYVADIAAPFDEEVDYEYHYSPTNSVDRKVSMAKAQIIQTLDSLTLTVTDGTATNTSKISITGSGIRFGGDNLIFKANSINLNTATIEGKLTAQHINADGITANNVTISGTITATYGKIGKLNITTDGLSFTEPDTLINLASYEYNGWTVGDHMTGFISAHSDGTGEANLVIVDADSETVTLSSHGLTFEDYERWFGPFGMKSAYIRAVNSDFTTDATDSITAGGLFFDADHTFLTDQPTVKLKDRLGGGGGGEPAAYLKSASVSGNTLTLTKKDDTTVAYTPSFDGRYVKLTGGTFSGPISGPGWSADNNGYVTSSWLRTNNASDLGSSNTLCVLSSGWIYTRSASGFISDHGIATQSWVQGYVAGNPTGSATAVLSRIKIGDKIYGIQSSGGDVTFDDFNPSHFIADSGENYPINLNLSTLNNTYARKAEINTFTKPNMILGIDSDGDTSDQPALLKVIHNANSSTTQSVWQGRAIVGTKDLTFLLGTYHGLAGIGAHSWSDVTTGSNAAWADFYLNPDGDKVVYIGKQLGNLGWLANRGILAINNSNAKAYYADASVNADPTTRTNFEIATHGWVTGTATIPWSHVSGAPSIPILSDFVTDTWSSISTKAPNNVIISQYLGDNYYDKTTVDTKFSDYYNKSTVDTKLAQYLKASTLPGYFRHSTNDDFTYSVSASEFGINSNRWALKSWVTGTALSGYATQSYAQSYVWDHRVTMTDNGSALATSGDGELRIACGNKMIFRKTNTNTITLESSLTCLIEGTKVLMADGTQKNIEHVQRGEVIASYNLEDKEPCSAVVIDCFRTGGSEVYNTLVFEDGNYIEFFGDHEIYNARTGDIKNVKIFAAGRDKAFTTDGREPLLAYKTNINHRESRSHYVLISSNCMYYAGGILMGHYPDTLYQYAHDVPMPEELHQSICDVAVWGNDNRERILEPDVLPELIEKLKTSYQARQRMEELGESLKSTDYVAARTADMFFAQFPNINNTGQLLKVIREINLDMGKMNTREEQRAEVRILEEEYEQAEQDVKDYLESHGINDGKYQIEKLYHANDVGNSQFDLWSNWAESLQIYIH